MSGRCAATSAIVAARVCRLADDLEIGLGFDDTPKPVTHKRVVVRQNDSRHALHVR